MREKVVAGLYAVAHRIGWVLSRIVFLVIAIDDSLELLGEKLYAFGQRQSFVRNSQDIIEGLVLGKKRNLQYDHEIVVRMKEYYLDKLIYQPDDFVSILGKMGVDEELYPKIVPAIVQLEELGEIAVDGEISNPSFRELACIYPEMAFKFLEYYLGQEKRKV